jgi:hypothetical protein
VVWRRKIWFNPPFLWKCLYQVRVITVFPVFRLLTDFVCLYTYEFWLSLWKIVRSSVILLLPLLVNFWLPLLYSLTFIYFNWYTIKKNIKTTVFLPYHRKSRLYILHLVKRVFWYCRMHDTLQIACSWFDRERLTFVLD